MCPQVQASDMAPANYFVDHVSKAYASLTSPKAMAAFEKFGHPDGAEVRSPYQPSRK